MKYVENYQTTDDKKEATTASYNKSGQEVTDNADTVYAKCQAINVRDSLQHKFYVLTSNGNIFDPNGIDSHRQKNIKTELRNTSKQTFEYYLNYLKTKNPIFLRRAERSFING
jgi:uncharacterized protein YaiI (UPF0178 family)